MEGDEYMQAISVSEAKQNFEKYCDDVIEKSDVIIMNCKRQKKKEKL